MGRTEMPFRLMGSVLVACLLASVQMMGCRKRQEGQEARRQEPTVNVMTADIQAGIENHIDEQIRAGNGYFKLAWEDQELSLKLVKVHTEYLANLGPGRHFACVDLVDTSGDVYDVDFFLAGESGAMTVTQTIVHKFNGKPFYTWEQKRDKTWQRVPVEGAAQELLGVVSGSDEFEFYYRATLPKITDTARMWIPLATTDAFQTVQVVKVEAPAEHRTLEETKHGNKVLFFEFDADDSGKVVELCYRVQRQEKGAYAGDAAEALKHLKPERLVPTHETFRTIAEKVTAGKTTDLMRARALYDHVIDRVSYIKHGEGWGQGDALYACDVRSGNCTDFHAYFQALARAVGIPARFAIGAAIPSSRNDGGVDGYHCWVEFYADGKWWPVDISEGDKYSSLATYYFGHHPANRFEFSRGRDLVVEPGPTAGPINFLAYPVFEMNGKQIKVKTQFLFRRGEA